MLVIDESAPRSLETAAQILSRGGIVVVPSRTNYSLVCDAASPDAIDRVFEAKRRTKFGPLTLAVPEINAVGRYVRFPQGFGLAELNAIWPAEVSFIFDLTHEFPPRMTMGAKTIAVMFQRPCALRRVVSLFEHPLAVTSANLSGQGNIVVTREKAIGDLGDEVDLVLVNDRPDEVIDVRVTGSNPSNTIVDLTSSPPRLARDGVYPPSQLRAHIPDLDLDEDAYKLMLARRLSAGTA